MKVKLTSEGQITIPTEIRQQLKLQSGDELLLILEGNDVKLRVLKPKRLSEFYRALPATVSYPGKEAIRQSVGENIF
ncbi:AbrB/MazE/SpoVT family DNA-binding domain-containing protein [Aerosakkonema funiforme]|uniref:AbrB/MazE/SpoVT family DNA-binding domain-containing protein n=1 Tax=Aerosakkonema funiforme TaxID=1246630 RepID=UPI0035B7CA4B